MDVIMDSVAETRDRLNRLCDPGGDEASPTTKPASRKCQHGRLSRNCELCDRDRKIESLDRLCRRQSAILTGVANALRGEPGETTSWSHHDLVERVEAALDGVESLRKERETQARRIAEMEARRISDMDTATKMGDRLIPQYFPRPQSRLLVLAAQLGRFKLQDRTQRNIRSEAAPRDGGQPGTTTEPAPRPAPWSATVIREVGP